MTVNHSRIQLVPERSPTSVDIVTDLQVRETRLGAIDVAQAVNHDSEDTLVYSLPWSSYVSRPDSADQYALLAHTLDRRVVVADNPGFGPHTAQPDRQMSRNIRSGNFDSVAQVQWEAMSDFVTTDGLTLVGNSLGASISASLLKIMPEDVRAERIVLWEAVSQTVSPALLTARFGLEGLRWRRYFSENPDWMVRPGSKEARPEVDISHMMPFLNYPIGLAKGRILNDLREARERETLAASTEVVVMSGSESRVSPERDNAALAERISKELGVTSVRQIVCIGESHGITDSSQRTTAALRLALA